jgi:hypothetical protein
MEVKLTFRLLQVIYIHKNIPGVLRKGKELSL